MVLLVAAQPVVASAASERPSRASATSGTLPFGHACRVEGGGIRFCPTPAPTQKSDQRVRSWDGAPLQVDVTLPATGTGPWPTLVILPGYGGSDGVSWESSGAGSQAGQFDNARFAKLGYAVVTMNYRGVGYGCGPPQPQSLGSDLWRTLDAKACQNVAFEFGDQRYDARDVQTVLGQLVDQGIANPEALGVSGESLGSLVTLEVALLYNRVRLLNGGFAPWTSPHGTPLHLSAAYPFWAVPDLMDGVAPNGRFISSQPQTAANDDAPLGAIKLSALIGIAGLAPALTSSTISPNGFDLFVDGILGEVGAPNGPGAPWLIRQIHDFHQSVGMPLGSGVAPLLVQDGWADLLVNGASQAMRIYDYLHVAAPTAKVALQLADVGHAITHNKPADVGALYDQAADFLDHYLRGRPGGPVPGSITAYTATCPAKAKSGGPYVAASLAELAPNTVRFSSPKPQLVLTGGDPTISVQFDPITGTGEQALPNGDPQCQPELAINWPGTAVYAHPVNQTFTMLGMPTMHMHVATLGSNGQLDARLWDVAPNGKQTYVSRGTYALTPSQTGTITWQMWGGGHTFTRGHTMRVELLAQDIPIERPSPDGFVVSVSNFSIELPATTR